MNFKKGDIIICDFTCSYTYSLTMDKRYVVLYANGDYIEIINDDGVRDGYDDFQFDLDAAFVRNKVIDGILE